MLGGYFNRDFKTIAVDAATAGVAYYALGMLVGGPLRISPAAGILGIGIQGVGIGLAVAIGSTISDALKSNNIV